MPFKLHRGEATPSGMIAMSMSFKVIFAAIVSVPSCYMANYIKGIKHKAGLGVELSDKEIKYYSNYPLKIDTIGALSQKPGCTQYKVIVCNKHYAFTMTANEVIDKYKNLDKFSENDRMLLEADISGQLLSFLNMQYPI